MVAEVNKEIPVKINSEIRFDNAIAEKETIIYRYTLLKYLDDNNENSTFDILDVKSSVCNGEDQSKLLNEGINFRFKYVNTNGELIHDLFITKNNCKI